VIDAAHVAAYGENTCGADFLVLEPVPPFVRLEATS
jgi:hypothetical protein